MPSRPDRFDALEGLRGWLAWAVVAGHLVESSGVGAISPLLEPAHVFATRAVEVFMILSGFVITHLLMQRRESYGRYLVRRLFRLMPLYLVALAAGAATIWWAASVLPNTDAWPWAAEVHEHAAAQSAHPGWHAFLHLTLLHGLVPNTILPVSEYAFLSPAWSLSVEWQFYLVAPALVWLCRRPAGAAFVVALAAVGWSIYHHINDAHPDSWYQLSNLLGALLFFAVGIASRLAWDVLSGRVVFAGAIALGLLVIGLRFGMLSLAIWGAVLVMMWADRAGRSDRFDALSHKVFDALLTSPAAIYFGARSFSVYLVHMPILLATAALIPHLGPYDPWLRFALLGVPVVLVTLAVSHLTYAAIERPAIRLGARLVAQPASVGPARVGAV